MDIKTKELLANLTNAKNRQDLNNSMQLIRDYGVEWQGDLSESEKQEIISLIRDKSLELIFNKGETPDREMLWAYGIFKDAQKDERFKGYYDLCAAQVRSDGISSYERLLFIEYAAVALLLSGEADGAVKFFYANIIYLNLFDNYIVELDKFVRAFTFYYRIPLEWFLEIQREALQDSYFDSLDDKIKKSVFLWSMHVFWNIEHFYNDLSWRDNFPVWVGVLEKLLGQGNLDLAMYVSFYIYHKFGNSAQLQEDWQVYNDKIVKLMEPYFVEYGKNLPKCKKKIDSSNGRKIKIAILEERIVENSPFKVEYSWCKAMLKNKEFASKYEIYMYSMAYVQKSEDSLENMKELQDIGVKVMSPAYNLIKQHFYYYPHLQKALLLRDSILKEGIDILITTSYTDASNFLIATRSAPKQLFWCHGNTHYDIKGIDDRISHFIPKHPKWNFIDIKTSMDKEKYYNPPCDSQLIANERIRYPIKDDTIVLGVIGRLVKVDSDEYLSAIAEVMKKHKNTIFIAAGNGNMPVIREKVEKLGISERFFMPGFTDPHIYGHIIDIFCSTFPQGQGESASEFYEKPNKYLVSMHYNKEALRATRLRIVEGLKNEIIEEYGEENYNKLHKQADTNNCILIAFNKEEYIDRISKIITKDSATLEAFKDYRDGYRKMVNETREKEGVRKVLKYFNGLEHLC